MINFSAESYLHNIRRDLSISDAGKLFLSKSLNRHIVVIRNVWPPCWYVFYTRYLLLQPTLQTLFVTGNITNNLLTSVIHKDLYRIYYDAIQRYKVTWWSRVKIIRLLLLLQSGETGSFWKCERATLLGRFKRFCRDGVLNVNFEICFIVLRALLKIALIFGNGS